MNKKIYNYAVLEPQELTREFHTSFEDGLTTSEAKRRLLIEGPNKLSSEQVHWWHILFRQLMSPFIYLLFIASGLAFILGETLDAVLILFFILINTGLGFYQEFKSEQVLRLLRQYTKLMAKVMRDGKQVMVSSQELVCGDVVILEMGDRVPADLRLIVGADVSVDEAVLTGESVAVRKNGLPLLETPSDIYEASNLLFTGTTVLEGSARGVVLATGDRTTLGQIKRLTMGIAKESIFVKDIAKFGGFILKLTVVTLVLVFLANLAIKGSRVNMVELLVFSIALAVSVIPEALPIVTTLTLSRGALKLAKQKVIVKRLSAVEDLGSIEVLCTDKTGTITENKLKVKELRSIKGRKNLLRYAHLAGAFARESLEPFDVALKEASLDKKEERDFTLLLARPFDPRRRSNSVLVKDRHGNLLFIVRGAPEEIWKLCADVSEEEMNTFKEWLVREGQQGLRTLAVASKRVSGNPENLSNLARLEKELDFEGCISFVDPIKKSVLSTIKKAKRLGVNIKVLTGDSQEVALNVAREMDLLDEDKQVVRASDFIALPKQEQKKRLPGVAVFARTDPEQKHYLVQLLQESYVVGFLGEGINDSPSLKVAGVSIVVQSAADIARETADIILLKKDLSVIVDGIEEGRKVFANTLKYIEATLASNFGNFYAVAIASLFIDFLPMLPVQLLLVNLLSDFPMMAMAADTVDPEEIRQPKKYNLRNLLSIAMVLGVVSTVFDLMFFGFFYKRSPEVLQTNWFIGSILTELVFLFSVRTHLPFYRAAFPPKIVLGLSASAFITTLIIPFTKIGQSLFHFIHPSTEQVFLILALVVAYFISSEVAKNFYYQRLSVRKLESLKRLKVSKLAQILR